MRIIACYSMKGGVGKTATAVNIAYWAAKTGNKTLLIDLDPQGASSFYFRVAPPKKPWNKQFFKDEAALVKHIKATDYDNLDIIPAQESFRNFDVVLDDFKKRRSRLGKVIKGLKGAYQLVVLDCPPTFSYLSEAVFNVADIILVPVIPSTLSERTFAQLHQFFSEKELPSEAIMPFFSMVQQQKSLHKRTMDSMRMHYPDFMDTVIPFNVDVENMGEHRAPVDVFARKRPANKAYYLLWKELVNTLKARQHGTGN